MAPSRGITTILHDPTPAPSGSCLDIGPFAGWLPPIPRCAAPPSAPTTDALEFLLETARHGPFNPDPTFVVRQRAIFDRIGAKLMHRQRQRVLWRKPDFRSFDVETIPPRGGQPTAQDAQGVQGRGSVDQATKNADERPMARVNCGCIGSRWMVLGSRHQSGMALCGATVSSII